jgi:hypothetical protein
MCEEGGGEACQQVRMGHSHDDNWRVRHRAMYMCVSGGTEIVVAVCFACSGGVKHKIV